MSKLVEANKSFRFYVDIIKSEGEIDKEFYVEGYAATTDLDRQGDIIVSDALKEAAKSLIDTNHTVFYNHEYDLQNAVGRIVDATVDDIGLKVRIYVSSLAKELRIKIKEGIITKFSIGGRILRSSVISLEEAKARGLIKDDIPNFIDRVNIIEKLELFEVSFVGVPANPNAQVVGSFIKALRQVLGGENMDEVKKEQETQEVQKEKSEITSEEIKDLLATEEKKEDKKPAEYPEAKQPYYYYYYYYYGKKMQEELQKLGEAIAAIKADVEEIKKDLKELKDLVKEKVKEIEVTTEKKTLIKKESPVEKKELTDDDIDKGFFKLITKNRN